MGLFRWFAPNIAPYFAPVLPIVQLDEIFTMGTKEEKYRLSRVRIGDRIYVEFYAWNVEKHRLERRRLYNLEGRTKRERVESAKQLAKEIDKLLVKGFVLGDSPKQVLVQPRFTLEAFRESCRIKRNQAGRDTTRSFTSFENIFVGWLTAEGLERVPIIDFKKMHIYAFLDWLKEERKISNRTRNNYLDRVKEALEVMVEREWIEKNPARGIKKLKSVSSSYVAFTQDQQQVLEKYLRSHSFGLYVFTRLIYHGFIRPVEITRLRLKHVDLENRVILVRASLSKNKTQQPVYITDGLLPDLLEFYQRYCKGIPENYYLFSKGWEPGPAEYNRKAFSVAHRKALEATELYNGELTGYSWKHTGVCNAYRAGADIKAIQDQCRHHSLEETEKYMRSLGLRINRGLKGVAW
ncbi:MAG: tyrosine-type recombinase/integrase [Bacteroidota bacterium]